MKALFKKNLREIFNIKTMITFLLGVLIGVIPQNIPRIYKSESEKIFDTIIIKQREALPDFEENITCNYLRLAGASQVYFLIDLFINSYFKDQSFEDPRFQSFWKQWKEDNKYQFIQKNEVLEQFYPHKFHKEGPHFTKYLKDILIYSCKDNISATTVLNLYLDYYNPNNKKYLTSDFDKFFNYLDTTSHDYQQNEMDLCSLYAEYKNIQFEGLYQEYLNCNYEIGFLFLFIENNSNFKLQDLKLTYKLLKHSINDSLEINDEYISKYFDTAHNSSIEITELKPNNKLLFLNSIYLKNESGYPRKYIANIFRPIEITYRKVSKGTLITEKIKLPGQDKKSHQLVPGGWFGQ